METSSLVKAALVALERHMKLVEQAEGEVVPLVGEYIATFRRHPGLRAIRENFDNQRKRFHSRHPDFVWENALYEGSSEELEGDAQAGRPWPTPRIEYIRSFIAKDAKLEDVPWYLFDELRSYLENHADLREKGLIIERTNLLGMLNTLNAYVIEELGGLSEIEGSQDISGVSYDAESGLLRIQGRKVKFRPGSDRGSVLRLLMEDEESMSKTWSCDDVYKFVTGDNLEGPTKKVYEACRGINHQVAIQAEIKDFLEFTLKTVRIKPSFLG